MDFQCLGASMIKIYTKGNQQLSYKVIFKDIKHIYMRKKSDYVLITANKKLGMQQVLNVLDQHFERLLIAERGSNRIKAPKYQLMGSVVSIDTFYNGLEHTQSNYEYRLVEATYTQIKYLENRLAVDLKILGLTLKPTKVKVLKSKFGSCHMIKKEITINAFLARLDVKYLYYVLLHEYCHFIEPNHSKAFYNLLDKIMPNHKMIQKALRKYVITF